MGAWVANSKPEQRGPCHTAIAVSRCTLLDLPDPTRLRDIRAVKLLIWFRSRAVSVNQTFTNRDDGFGMPDYRRPPRSTRPVFFTVCLAQRGSTALVDHLTILRAAVRDTLADRPLESIAWVVLPDHLHAIWRLPIDDMNYSQRWGRIKARFSRDARRAGLIPPPPRPGFQPRKGELGIWQQRFWEHHCRDAQDLERHLHYCWLDPVRHGHVERPADWAASSIHRDIRLGRIAADWFGNDVPGRFGEAA